MQNFEGPIPGENYTSDTKNYPWHRPPEFDDLDKAIDYIGKRLTKEENAANANHAIFTGFAPFHDPKYSISVVVEHGGSGSGAAAPIAKDIMMEVQGLNKRVIG